MTKFEEGEKAARSNLPVCSCPYGKGTAEYADWMKGFRHAARRQDATTLNHG